LPSDISLATCTARSYASTTASGCFEKASTDYTTSIRLSPEIDIQAERFSHMHTAQRRNQARGLYGARLITALDELV